ncbi:hypothetical protein JCM3770_002233 [Rhodotorula araucariae]
MGDEQYAFTIPPPADDAPVSARPAVPLTGKYIHPDRREDRPQPNNKRKAPSHDRPALAPRAAPAAHASGAQEDADAPAPPQDDDEERPLSHKEKRLAKKRKLAAEAAGLDPDAPAPAAQAPSSAPAATTIGTTLVGNTPARSAHGIWLGNLNYATHPRELLQWFAAKGLKDVVRINMPGGKRSHENNRGFAYLDFPTAEDQAAAVALSEQHLDGRKLLIKASSDYTGRPAPAPVAGGTGGGVKDVLASLDPSALEQPDPRAAATAGANGDEGGAANAPPPTLNRTARKILSRQKNPAGPTLFLGNLGFETKVDDIREMFDRNQVRSMEWAPKEKGAKGKKGAKSKGKGKEEAGEESSDEEDVDTDRADDESDSDDSSDEDDSADNDADKDGGEDQKGKGKGKKEKKPKGPKDLAQAKDAGIRKIRLGTFEDTGKCKGWAFVDFHLAAQATRALLNLHNHQLNGRKLNLEYASAEAVRRGQLGSRAVSKAHGRQQRREAPGMGEGDEQQDDRRRAAGGAGGRKRGEREWDDGDVKAFAAEAAAADAAAPPARQRREKRDGGGAERRGRERGGEPQGLPGGKRAKPGAALAMAQRASEAIVASTGRKTTFE